MFFKVKLLLAVIFDVRIWSGTRNLFSRLKLTKTFREKKKLTIYEGMRVSGRPSNGNVCPVDASDTLVHGVAFRKTNRLFM